MTEPATNTTNILGVDIVVDEPTPLNERIFKSTPIPIDELAYIDDDIRERFGPGTEYYPTMPTNMQLIKELQLLGKDLNVLVHEMRDSALTTRDLISSISRLKVAISDLLDNR